MSSGNYPIFADSAAKVLVNKSIDGGTADPNHWVTLPAGTTVALAALERRVGAVAYDTTLGKIVFDNGSGFAAVATTAATPIASAIANTPAGGIAATNVQTALNELDTEKLALAGGALTGAITSNSSIGTVGTPIPTTYQTVSHTATTIYTPSDKGQIAYQFSKPSGGDPDVCIVAASGSAAGMAVFTDSLGGANATPTANLYLETGNKTAGTGNSGTISLNTGTSVGGTRGPVAVNALGLQIVTTASRPAASVTYRGMLYHQAGGGGVTDEIQICMKTAADGYAWITIADGEA